MKPSEKIISNLANLLDVRTIMTLVIVFIFCYAVIANIDLSREFFLILTAVVTYWLCNKGSERSDGTCKTQEPPETEE